MEKIRVGVVGLGAIARKMHLPVLSTFQDVIIDSAAEKDAERGRKTAKKWQIENFYSDYQEMYEEGELDAVFICLPNFLHYDAVHQALENDLNVFCEKPMGLNTDEARKLVELSQKKDLKLAVGYNRRLEKNYQNIKNIVKSLKLGRILQLHGILVNPGPYGGWIPSSDWFFKDKYGVLFDSGPHLMDLIMHVLSDRIVEVSALGVNTMHGTDILDNITGVLKTEKEVIGSFNIGWRAGLNYDSLQIHGTGCSAFADYFETRLRPGSFKTVDKISENINSTRQVISNLMSLRGGDLPDETFFQEDRAFLDGHPSATGKDALRVLEVLEAIKESIDGKKLVKLDK